MIYLDNAATTYPKPSEVVDIVQRGVVEIAGTPGRGGLSTANRSTVTVDAVRKSVAHLFHTFEDYRVIFTSSATDSLNIAIKGFIDDGDSVLISSMEHNSVLRPLRRMQEEGRITLDIVKCDDYGYIDIDHLRECLKVKRKLVVISHASNVTGAIQDIDSFGKLIRESGAFFLLDASQSAGVVDIDMMSERSCIDFLALSGHKNIYGLQGSGLLILGSRVMKLRPFREGGTGFDSKSETQPINLPEALEAGTHNMLGIVSIGAGIEFINKVGIDNINSKERLLLKKIYDSLLGYKNVTIFTPPLEKHNVANILSFTIDGWSSQDVGDILSNNYEIYIRTGLHCAPLAHKRIGTYPDGTVRVSPGYFNSEHDVDEFIKAIKIVINTELIWY